MKFQCKDSCRKYKCILEIDYVDHLSFVYPFDETKKEWELISSTFTMLIGIPGSGKSTWLKNNCKNSIIVCPDQIRKDLTGNISDQSKNDEVWKIAKEAIIKSINANKDCILDATNVNTQKRIEFMKNLPECTKNAVVFNVKPEIAYSRISKDISDGKDRSNVPEDVVYRMYGELLYTMKVLDKEGFDKIEYVEE